MAESSSLLGIIVVIRESVLTIIELELEWTIYVNLHTRKLIWGLLLRQSVMEY